MVLIRTTNLPRSNATSISTGCWAAQPRASTFTEQHCTAKEAQAPGELFKRCPMGSLEIAGHKGAHLEEFTIPNRDSVEKLLGVIFRERLQPFPTLPQTAGFMMLDLPAAYGGLKNKNDSSNVQIYFITQKYACSSPEGNQCLKKNKYSAKYLFSLLLPRGYFLVKYIIKWKSL